MEEQRGKDVRPVDFSWLTGLLVHYYCFGHGEWLVIRKLQFENGNTETGKPEQKIRGTGIKRSRESPKKSFVGSVLVRRGEQDRYSTQTRPYTETKQESPHVRLYTVGYGRPESPTESTPRNELHEINSTGSLGK